MAPSKPKAAQDDSRSEGSSTKEKAAHAATHSVAKGRRGGGTAASSSLRDVTNASATAAGTASTVVANTEPIGMQWNKLDHHVLHSYRDAYRLKTPSAFNSEYNQLILTRPGIGRFSPTMARQKDKRRQSKDQLANAVRKHFNGQGIQENEAVVEFLYKVKWQDKNFRMRFAPPQSSTR